MANCKTCIHAAVCAKRIATGGHVKECNNFAKKKTGRWEYHWFDAYCSECGYFNRADGVTRTRSDHRFCPGCGADMRPKEDQDG